MRPEKSKIEWITRVPKAQGDAHCTIRHSMLRSPYQLSEIHMARDAFMGYWSTPQGHGLRSMTEIWVMVRFPRQPTRWIQKSMDYDRVWVLPMMGYDRVDCSMQHVSARHWSTFEESTAVSFILMHQHNKKHLHKRRQLLIFVRSRGRQWTDIKRSLSGMVNGTY